MNNEPGYEPDMLFNSKEPSPKLNINRVLRKRTQIDIAHFRDHQPVSSSSKKSSQIRGPNQLTISNLFFRGSEKSGETSPKRPPLISDNSESPDSIQSLENEYANTISVNDIV